MTSSEIHHAPHDATALAETETAAPRRVWSAPLVIVATVGRGTNKTSDYNPEGKASGTTIIS